MEYNETDAYSCYAIRYGNDSMAPALWVITERSRPSSLVTAVCTLVFIIIGLPGNALIILSILRQRLYREPAHILLLDLALTDLLVCVLVMPLTVVAGFAGGWVLGDSDRAKCAWCLTGLVFVALCLLSLHTLALMSLDRLLFIKCSMKYGRYVTTRRTVLCIIVLWVVCLVFSTFPSFGFGDVRFTYSISTCSLKIFGETRLTSNINYLIFLVAIAVCPFTVIIVCNAWLLCIVQQHIRRMYAVRKTLPKNSEQRSFRNQLRREKNHKQLRLTGVFVAVIGSNVLTWLPLIVRAVLTAVKGNDLFPLGVYVFVYLSLTSSAVFHPLIQACLIPEVRAQCKRFLTVTFCSCVGAHSSTATGPTCPTSDRTCSTSDETHSSSLHLQ